MTTVDTQALVLRVVDFGESDRIAHLLTPVTSRVTVIAKGAKRSKRRFPGTLDLFHLLDVRIERRRPTSMARLEQARLVDAWTPLRAHPARFALACYLVELVDRLAPEGGGGREARALFAAVLGALGSVAAREPDARTRTWIELRVLAALGLRPELRHCVRCGRDVLSASSSHSRRDEPDSLVASQRRAASPSTALIFHVGEGGPICAACARPDDAGPTLHLGTLRALEQGLALPVDRLDRLALGTEPIAEARALLARFLRFHVGLELRSERFLDTFQPRASA